MARVTRAGGTIATYAWDLFTGGFPLEPILAELRAMNVPSYMPPSPEASRTENLRALWSAAGATDMLSPEALQTLMAAACNLYSAQVEAGQQHLPLKPLGVPPTAVMSTASGILRAANLAVFELGMWQSWTGR